MAFTHLHVHTEYSLLDGMSKIKELTAQAKKLGMDSIAITDHGVMFGAISFYLAAKENGVKPIIGCEIYVSPGSRLDKEKDAGEDRYHHLVLLAENYTGYKNLMKIVSRGYTEGYYYKPRVDYQVLREYHEGIIALSACLGGEVQRFLLRGMYEEGLKAAENYREIFGENNFFLELQDHGIQEQKNVNQQLLRMSSETGIELIATNDVHYIYENDVIPHDVLLCIQTNKKVTDEDRMKYEGGQFYLKSEEEMKGLFPYALQALENTNKIAERCNVELDLGCKGRLPKFDVPEGYTSSSYLLELCTKGLEKRYGNPKEDLKERLSFELSTIENMGFVDYFLIVWDFIRYAKENGIAVGPGRGSAAGSIVAYCLGITDIDPIRYSLLFERFLNPDRISMPDIDIDFCYVRRQEVIDYVIEKYGHDRVVQIVTFNTMAAKGVLRDVGRALDMPYAQVDVVAKMIPNDLGMTIEKALTQNKELLALYENDESVKKLIDMGKRLEGLSRNSSIHAAGVVIAPESADEFVPLLKISDGPVTTQFVMSQLEDLGLLKMDFLGLRTLTVIQDASNLAGIDINGINLDDKDVYDYIGSGRTDGVFQLESSGMKSFMRELKPHCLEDIIAGISLYRPGPMDFIPKYVRGKNNRDTITYDCEQLKPILEPTYGCIVYQEQVMQIVRDLGGYTLARSDSLRRAMSKKKADVMAAERKNFVYGNEEENVPGCVKMGINEKVADKIYDDMVDFAKYAFNKSHAAAYAVLAYQTAYLKYHYPIEFMAALITSVMDKTTKVSEYILACKEMGIKILPPDVNEGQSMFSVTEDSIRYGLSAIKSVGRNVIESIVNERNANGKYTSLNDFAERLSGKDINKRAVENFIKAGAFDSMPGTRKQKLLVFTSVMDSVNQKKKKSLEGQVSLFDLVSSEEKSNYEIKMPEVGEHDKETLLMFEKEVLGIYIGGHPLDKYIDIWEKNITAKSTDFYTDEEGKNTIKDGENATIGGIISAITKKTTKNGGMMAFITLEDLVGTVEVVIFPKDYEMNRNLIKEDGKVFVKGRVSLGEDEQGKLVCQRMTPFEELPKEVWIKFKNMDIYFSKEKTILEVINSNKGKDTLIAYIEEEKKKKIFPDNCSIKADDKLKFRLEDLFGKDNIRIVEKYMEVK